MGFIKEFREFAMRGNVIDMAVGIVIGAAFGKIVSSLVGDIVMPLVGQLTGGVDYTEMKLVLQEAATDESGNQVAEVAINYGTFISTVIDFVIIAFAIFIVIKMMNTAKKRLERKALEAPVSPPELSTTDKLLTEIRDSLGRR